MSRRRDVYATMWPLRVPKRRRLGSPLLDEDHAMAVLHVNGIRYRLTSDGRLVSLSEWNEDVAYALARQDDIELSDAHWEILCVMRLFYQEFNISPVRKLLRRTVAERLEPEKASDRYFNDLFPGGVEIQGTRIAGLPIPLLDEELVRGDQSADLPPDANAAAQVVEEFEFEGARYQIYPHGNLVDPEQWNVRVAELMAGQEGIELTAEHWELIYFLRRFYFEYGISPMVRLLMRHMEAQFGREKSSEPYLYSLFPGGPSRQGSRIAGLPEPQGCIDP